MLRAYPKSVIKKFGHANIFLLLDATEILANIASMIEGKNYTYKGIIKKKSAFCC